MLAYTSKYYSKKDTQVTVLKITAGSVFDGPGTRIVIYFQGCNVGCIWCHSPHLIPTKSVLLFSQQYCNNCRICEKVCPTGVHSFIEDEHVLDRSKCIQCGKCIENCPNSSEFKAAGALIFSSKATSAEELFSSILPSLSILKSCGGITLSGGEALMQKEGAKIILELCRNHGIHTAVETSGLLSSDLYKEFDPLVDCWLFGIRFTTNYPSKDHSKRILQSFKAIDHKKVFIRIPVIPKHTDTDWYLNKCLSLLNESGIRIVYLNPWNTDTPHYYKLSGIHLRMEMPQDDEVTASENYIRDFFSKHGVTCKDMKDEKSIFSPSSSREEEDKNHSNKKEEARL